MSTALVWFRQDLRLAIKLNTGGRGYCYKQADAMAKERRAKASQAPKKLTQELISIIEDRIQKDWSPDQITGRSST